MKTIGTIAQIAGITITSVGICYPIIHAGAEILFGSSVVLAGIMMNPDSFFGMMDCEASGRSVTNTHDDEDTRRLPENEDFKYPFMVEDCHPEDEDVASATDQFQMYYTENDIMSADLDSLGKF